MTKPLSFLDHQVYMSTMHTAAMLLLQRSYTKCVRLMELLEQLAPKLQQELGAVPPTEVDLPKISESGRYTPYAWLLFQQEHRLSESIAIMQWWADEDSLPGKGDIEQSDETMTLQSIFEAAYEIATGDQAPFNLAGDEQYSGLLIAVGKFYDDESDPSYKSPTFGDFDYAEAVLVADHRAAKFEDLYLAKVSDDIMNMIRTLQL